MTRPEAPPRLEQPVIDAHCHLELPYGDEPEWSMEQHLAAASAVGVTSVVQTGFDLTSSRLAVRLAGENPHVIASVALHPNEAPRIHAEHGESALQEAWAQIDALADAPGVHAIGETGMDFFRTGPDGREVQERSFRQHIRMAKKHNLALVIHDRDSHDDVIRVLLDEGAPERVMFHSFSGDAAMAQIAADHGWYLSFSGTVTYKNAPHLREALHVIDRNHILVETDAPFLPPVPHRGQPNSSYLIPITLRAMAQELGEDVDVLAAQVRDNTVRVFALA